MTRATGQSEPGITVVVETFNHVENEQPIELLRRSLHSAVAALSEVPAGEVVLADVTGGAAEIIALLDEFPSVRRVDVFGARYDEAKSTACRYVTTPFVAHLDGDCQAQPGWLQAHLSVLAGGASLTAGQTRFHGGFVARVMCTMTFGFQLGRSGDVLDCYAGNNVAHRRELLDIVPVPPGPMRSRAYAHTTLLRRAGHGPVLIPEAVVLHVAPAVIADRLFRGHDHIAACWTAPDLRESRFLRWGPFAGPAFYLWLVRLDLGRLARFWRQAGFRSWQVPLAAATASALRLLDLVGMVRALRAGPPGAAA